MLHQKAHPRASTLLTTSLKQQTRHASLLRRPRRPYQFTQLITLSDGSTFMHRTTSPAPIYRSIKDTRNNPLWNPSSQKLLNIEEDEAGRLKRFRARFGRGFDAEAAAVEGEEGAEEEKEGEKEESLMELIGKGATRIEGGKVEDKKAPKKGGKK